MEQLKVIGIEEGALIVATVSGERFTLAADETLRAHLRRAHHDTEARVTRPRPREIQAHIRAGLSAQEVADLLGTRLEDVQRYEHPVLAEREHIVDQALAVPVLIGGELDPGAQPTFGVAVRAKLADAGAVGERWTSWREEETGWIVKVEFTANEVDHDARWSFDPRRSTLAPLNSAATQLSHQGSLPEGLIPRLRALDPSPLKDSSRFDSGAFAPRKLEADATVAVQEAAIKRAPDASVTSAETADLLEALRRRRGLREPMPSEKPKEQAHAPVALFDALEPGYDGIGIQDSATRDSAARDSATRDSAAQDSAAGLSDTVATESTRRKGRTAMPSWDEIVFGARTEDA
ncbi:MAG: septation protein SepH [Microbacterium sp.]